MRGYADRRPRTRSASPGTSASERSGPPLRSRLFSPTLLSDTQQRVLQPLREGLPRPNRESPSPTPASTSEAESSGEGALELDETLEFAPSGEHSLEEAFGDRREEARAEMEMDALRVELNAMRGELSQARDHSQELINQIRQLQGQVNELERARPAGANSTRPGILKPDTFGQKDHESWPNFRRRFEHCARFNCWDSEQQKLALVSAMVGKAADAIGDLKVEQFQDCKGMLDAFEKRFMPAAQSDIVRIQFDRCRQNARESVLEFHARLRALYRRAYPQSNDDTQLIRRFAFGLANPLVQQMVLRKQVQSYDAALEAALNESAVMDVTETLRAGVSSANNLLPSATALTASEGGPEPMEIGALGSNECMFCGRTGHWKSKCQLWNKARRLLTNRRGGGRGNRPSNGSEASNRGNFGGRGRGFGNRGRGRAPGYSNPRDKERQRSMFRQIVAAIQSGEFDAAGDEDDDEPSPVASVQEPEEEFPEGDDLDDLVAAMTDEEIDELFQSGFA